MAATVASLTWFTATNQLDAKKYGEPWIVIGANQDEQETTRTIALDYYDYDVEVVCDDVTSNLVYVFYGSLFVVKDGCKN